MTARPAKSKKERSVQAWAIFRDGKPSCLHNGYMVYRTRSEAMRDFWDDDDQAVKVRIVWAEARAKGK